MSRGSVSSREIRDRLEALQQIADLNQDMTATLQKTMDTVQQFLATLQDSVDRMEATMDNSDLETQDATKVRLQEDIETDLSFAKSWATTVVKSTRQKFPESVGLGWKKIPNDVLTYMITSFETGCIKADIHVERGVKSWITKGLLRPKWSSKGKVNWNIMIVMGFSH
jgi:exonuclease VII large subunit